MVMAQNTSQKVNLVCIAQGLISHFGDIQLTIDGVVGKNTREAFVMLKPQDKAYVEQALVSITKNKNVLSELGLQDLTVATDKPDKGMVPLIKSYCKSMNFPETTAILIFYIESGLNPNVVSHTGAIGLGQLTRIAVQDVFPKASRKEIDDIMVTLKKPDVNIPISIRSMQNSLKYLNRLGKFNYTENNVAELYMAYNIGARAAVQVLKGEYNSKLVVEMVGHQGSLGPPSQYEFNVRKRLNKAAQQLGLSSTA